MPSCNFPYFLLFMHERRKCQMRGSWEVKVHLRSVKTTFPCSASPLRSVKATGVQEARDFRNIWFWRMPVCCFLFSACGSVLPNLIITSHALFKSMSIYLSFIYLLFLLETALRAFCLFFLLYFFTQSQAPEVPCQCCLSLDTLPGWAPHLLAGGSPLRGDSFPCTTTFSPF